MPAVFRMHQAAALFFIDFYILRNIFRFNVHHTGDNFGPSYRANFVLCGYFYITSDMAQASEEKFIFLYPILDI